MPYKLFIFAVGGTGSRVVKSLTMLLASGIKLKDVSAVIPIIVDPHKANLDLKRTEELLKTYKKIRDSSEPAEGNLFSTEIKTLGDVVPNGAIQSTYTFQLQNVGNKTFRDYIEYDQLIGNIGGNAGYSPNKDLADLLFSKTNLDTEMDIGFVGHPNIGSVVFNQFKDSDAFNQFASNYADGDRIFIISSIFGGTGAAGFPIILKNIRGAIAQKTPNHNLLKNARIGGVTVLPYFGIEPKSENKIDASTFISKTKAALQYYSRGINKLMNRMYYVGDLITENYQYDPGDNGQKNKAHFVELAAATSIIDFANIPDSELNCFEGKPTESIFKEFGIKNDKNNLNFADLGSPTNSLISKKLSRLTIFNLFLENRLEDIIGKNVVWANTEPKLENNFKGSTFYGNLKTFKASYFEWLAEMESNNRSFKPFVLTNELSTLIEGQTPKKGLLGLFGKANFDSLDTESNTYLKGKNFSNIEKKVIEILSNSIDMFINSKYPNLNQ